MGGQTKVLYIRGLERKKKQDVYILSNCYHKDGLTKINHSFLNGTNEDTDRISGILAANRMLKLFIIPEYPKLY